MSPILGCFVNVWSSTSVMCKWAQFDYNLHTRGEMSKDVNMCFGMGQGTKPFLLMCPPSPVFC